MTPLKPRNPRSVTDQDRHPGYRTDTIVAQATPAGIGGVAVVRISGPRALSLTEQLCKAPLREHPRSALLAEIRTPAGSLLDKALVTYFSAPASFTGEDVVEISTHGGHITPRRVITALTSLGARTAEPGEFSLRAFLNGKMDLSEAEALNQLVSSLSLRGQEAATENLTGRLSMQIRQTREALLNLATILEHEMDFTEDEIDGTPMEVISETLQLALEQLVRLKETAPYGRLIRDGIRVVLAGPPNSGKSSLFNALQGKDRALVTDLPGTTRDSLEGWIQIAGYPICLVDTAGLQETDSPLDKLGVERSRKQLAYTDIILYLDPENPREEASKEIGAVQDKRILYLQSKADLKPDNKWLEDTIPVSIISKNGLDAMIAEIKKVLDTYTPAKESAVVTSDRQLATLEKAIDRLNAARDQIERGLTTDIISAEIRLALDHLAEIIGETTSEEVIHRIFSEFCVGK